MNVVSVGSQDDGWQDGLEGAADGNAAPAGQRAKGDWGGV